MAASRSEDAARDGSSGLLEGDVKALDELMAFLRRADPWFETLEEGAWGSGRPSSGGEREQLVFAVCGNWYDLPHKAPELARAAAQEPSADLLLTGGREERLTPQAAVELGGEPLLLQRALRDGFGVRPGRMVVYTGSRVTNHNLRMVLHYAKQVHEFTGRATRLRVVEEGFLVRRAAASLAAQLREDAAAAAVLSEVRFVAVGPRAFRDLASAHRGRTDVALALVLGELARLRRYQAPGAAVTATHGLVHRGALLDAGALDALEPSLAERLAALRARHEDGLAAAGRRVLEELPRGEMLRVATPLQGPASALGLRLRGGGALLASWPTEAAGWPILGLGLLAAIAGCAGLAALCVGRPLRWLPASASCRARGLPP